MGQIRAQFFYPSPGDYVDYYAVSTDSNTPVEDTISWVHRTYTNGFLSMESGRDTAWAGADLTTKRVFFGNQNQLDSIHFYQVNGPVETLTHRNLFEYPSSNEKVTRGFNLYNNAFQESNRQYETFDNNGRRIEETFMSTNWQSNQLEYSFQRTYHFTAFDAVDTMKTFQYENGNFVQSDLLWRTYNAANNVVDNFYAGIENGVMIMEQRYEHFYNNSGELDHIHHYFYSSNTSFELERYYAYDHDLQGNTTYEIEYDVIGPDTLNDWYFGHETYFGYDGPLLVSERFVQYTSNGPTTFYDNRYVYSSTIFPTGIETASNIQLSVFPNPASNELKLEAETSITYAAVFDLQGQQVLSVTQSASNQMSIPIASLPAGQYIVYARTMSDEIMRQTFFKH
jgi:hypothetical protein